MKTSIVIILPCLNEEAGLGKTLSWAMTGLKNLSKKYPVRGDILVVDNGSTDNSLKIVRKMKVHLMHESKKGYGHAYLAGFRSTKADVIVMADCDATYDLRELPALYQEITRGADLVLGSRFLNKKISAQAIPLLNRYLGNPILTGMINVFYNCRVSDTQTGFRMFKRNILKTMNLKSGGMELASEMIIKAIAYKIKIAEVPISYYPRAGQSKLSPLSDAWRHIKSILIYSPTYAIIIPGLILFLIGISGTLWLLPGPVKIGIFAADIHVMIGFVLLTTLAVNIVLTGVFARLYTVRLLNIRGGWLTQYITGKVTLNRILLAGFAFFIFGFLMMAVITWSWLNSGMGPLNKSREFMVALGFMNIGSQLLFSSLLFGLLVRDN